MAKAPKPKNGAPVPPSPTNFTTSIFPARRASLPKGFGKVVKQIESHLQLPVWMIIQSQTGSQFDDISSSLKDAVFGVRAELPQGQPIALLIDSPGGYAKSAYQLANFFRRQCGSYIAVVPRYAKSAATLLALGASKIILGREAELGPLDAQVHDRDREEVRAALDEFQVMERLYATAMTTMDQLMLLLLPRTGKKLDMLLPASLKFVSDSMRPLFEKIDTVQFTQVARVLKIAEEYATRLLQRKYQTDEAEGIARKLVYGYPTHDFVIDHDEAERIRLQVELPNAEMCPIMEHAATLLGNFTAIGCLKEAQNG